MYLRRALLLAVAISGLSIAPAQAALIVTITEVGGDVLVVGSGTADLDDLTFLGSARCSAWMFPAGTTIILGEDPASHFVIVDMYRSIVEPISFGSGSATIATHGGGDRFGVFNVGNLFSVLFVPHGYVSGDFLIGLLLFSGASFASLGVTPGVYEWTWGSEEDADSFTLNIVAPVPEPASLTLLGLGLAGMGVRRWQQQRKA